MCNGVLDIFAFPLSLILAAVMLVCILLYPKSCPRSLSVALLALLALGFALCYGLQLAVVFALCHTSLSATELHLPYITLTGYAIATLIGNITYTLLNYLYNKHITFRPTTQI